GNVGGDGGYGAYQGGDGGHGGNGGTALVQAGGSGGVTISSGSLIMNAAGGDGGGGGNAGSDGYGGYGGNGGGGGLAIVRATGTGDINLSGGSLSIWADGGSGGNGGNAAGYGGYGGYGGHGGGGGDVAIQAYSGNVVLAGTGITIDTGGGYGGSGGGGGSSGADGGSGAGGYAGSTLISAGGDIDMSSTSMYGGSITGGLEFAAGGTLWVNENISINDSLTLAGGTVVVADGKYAESESNVAVFAGTLTLANGAEIYSDYNLGVLAGEINLAGGAGLYAANDVVILTGGLTMDSATIQAYSGMATIASTGNITLENGSLIRAGTDVKLNLTGADSLLTINSTSGGLASSIWANSPSTIYLNFPLLATGGVVIDGVETLETMAGYSGLFVGPGMTPAAPGAGLVVSYRQDVGSAAVTDLIRALEAVNLDESSDDVAPKGPKSTQSAGGEEGEFGEDEGDDKDKKDGASGGKPRPKGTRRAATCS
ncbi:MAG: hypothetical protein K8S22_18855, partial [Betaproteobacteria bacterium]|nr:hypothetical protein [Betaproteobacteria bacterium]